MTVLIGRRVRAAFADPHYYGHAHGTSDGGTSYAYDPTMGQMLVSMIQFPSPLIGISLAPQSTKFKSEGVQEHAQGSMPCNRRKHALRCRNIVTSPTSA